MYIRMLISIDYDSLGWSHSIDLIHILPRLALQHVYKPNMDGSNDSESQQMVHSEIDVKEYEEGGPTRIPLATSRAQNLYTQRPMIDSDGLSWPSK